MAPSSMSGATPGTVSTYNVTLTNYNKKETTDIKALVLETNIYEDIFAPGITGDVTMLDAQGLASELPIVGDERLKIEVSEAGKADDQEILEVEMRVYKMDNKQPFQDRGTMYSLFGATGQVAFDYTQDVCAAYGPAPAEVIARNLYVDYYTKFTNKPLHTPDPCRGTQTFIFPHFSPIRAMSLVASEAESTAYPGSVMVFYETHGAYYFRSIASLFSQKPVERYLWTPTNLEEDASGLVKLGHRQTGDKVEGGIENEMAFSKHQLVIELSQKRSFDILRGLTNGQYGMTVFTLDPLFKRYTSSLYRYAEDFKTAKHVGGGEGEKAFRAIPSTSPLYTAPEWAHGRYLIAQGTHALSSFSHSREQVAKDDSKTRDRIRQTTAAKAMAQLMQLQNTSTFIVAVPGYAKLSAGKCIELIIPEMTGAGKKAKNEYSKFTTGKYLITSCCHRIGSEYTTILECMNDSYTLPPIHELSPVVGTIDALRQVPLEEVTSNNPVEGVGVLPDQRLLKV